jgi:hypothetical protein
MLHLLLLLLFALPVWHAHQPSACLAMGNNGLLALLLTQLTCGSIQLHSLATERFLQRNNGTMV